MGRRTIDRIMFLKLCRAFLVATAQDHDTLWAIWQEEAKALHRLDTEESLKQWAESLPAPLADDNLMQEYQLAMKIAARREWVRALQYILSNKGAGLVDAAPSVAAS